MRAAQEQRKKKGRVHEGIDMWRKSRRETSRELGEERGREVLISLDPFVD